MTKREITTGALITLLLGLAAPLWAQVQLPDPVYQISMSASYEPEDHHIDGAEEPGHDEDEPEETGPPEE